MIFLAEGGLYINFGKTVFSLIMEFIPKYKFDKLVSKYPIDSN